MQIVTAAERRRTVTPNATMTTLATPSLGAAATRSWLVHMDAAAEGPVHAFVDEVIWSITAGSVTVELDRAVHRLRAGDTAVLPARVLRRFVAGDTGFDAVVMTHGSGAVVRDDDDEPVVPPWVA